MTELSQEQMPLAATRKELDQEPLVTARVIDSLYADIVQLARKFNERKINQVLIIGSGDSYSVGLAARHAFHTYTHIGITVLQALEFTYYGYPNIDEHTAILVISSSGRKSIIWDALDRAVTTPALIIGITDNTEQSNPILQKADTVLLPHSEKIGWPTQTTAAALSVLLLMAIVWGYQRHNMPLLAYEALIRQLKSLPDKMKTVLEASRSFASQVASKTFKQDTFTIIASGPNDGIAQIGTALLAEGPQRLGLALPLEEFHHSLRQFTLQPGNPVILISTHATCLQRPLDTARVARERDALLVGILGDQTRGLEKYCHYQITIPETPETLSPLLTLVPFQELSIQLAEMRISQGYNRPHR